MQVFNSIKTQLNIIVATISTMAWTELILNWFNLLSCPSGSAWTGINILQMGNPTRCLTVWIAFYTQLVWILNNDFRISFKVFCVLQTCDLIRANEDWIPQITWFDRERTCPMCRAQVTDDPEWRDGATSFFIQLYWWIEEAQEEEEGARNGKISDSLPPM